MLKNVKKQFVATFIVASVVFATAFSSYLLAAEIDHDCTGEDCPICICIESAAASLQQMSSGAAPLEPAIDLLAVFAIELSFALIIWIRPNTLVSCKVRLNN